MATNWFIADLHLYHKGVIAHGSRYHYLGEGLAAKFLGNDAKPRGEAKQAERKALVAEIPDEALEAMYLDAVEGVGSRVKKGDALWILGDLCWGNSPNQKARRIEKFLDDLDRKVGTGGYERYLVNGNHDDPVPQVPEPARKKFMNLSDGMAPCFDELYEAVMVSGDSGVKVWCSHYPHLTWPDRTKKLAPGEGEKPKVVSVHAYGHVHGAYAQDPPVRDPVQWAAVDVGVDAVYHGQPRGFTPWSESELWEEAGWRAWFAGHWHEHLGGVDPPGWVQKKWGEVIAEA